MVRRQPSVPKCPLLCKCVHKAVLVVPPKTLTNTIGVRWLRFPNSARGRHKNKVYAKSSVSSGNEMRPVFGDPISITKVIPTNKEPCCKQQLRISPLCVAESQQNDTKFLPLNLGLEQLPPCFLFKHLIEAL